MYIPHRSGYPLSGGCRVFLPELVTKTKHTKHGDLTEIAVERVDQSKQLPSMEEFELKNQLAAGVPLEQVRTTMYDSGDINLSSEAILSDVKPSQESEKKSDDKQTIQTDKGEN